MNDIIAFNLNGVIAFNLNNDVIAFNLLDVIAINRPPAPIFSWCGSSTHYDMVVPTYKMVSATVFGKDLENVQEVDGTSFEVGGPWAKKREAVYFRGRPSSDVRYELVEVFFFFSFFCTGMDIEVT